MTEIQNGNSGPPRRSTSGLRSILSWVVKLGVVAGIFAFLIYRGSIKPADLLGLLERWPTTLLAVMLLLPSVVVCALRFKLLLRAFAIEARFGELFALSMIGMLFDLVAPVANGGDLVKAVYIYKAPSTTGKKPFGLLLFCVVLDRVIGLFALFAFALAVSVLAWPQISGFANLRRMVLFVVCVCAGSLLVFFVLVSEKLERSALRKRLMNWLPLHEKIERIYAGFAGLRHHKGPLLIMLALSVINHVCSCACVLVLSQGVAFTSVLNNQPAALAVVPCVTVLPLALFLNTFGMAGGFGVGNLAFDELFKNILGLKGGATLALYYQVTGVLFRFFGIPFLIFYRQKGVDLDVTHAPEAAVTMEDIPTEEVSEEPVEPVVEEVQ